MTYSRFVACVLLLGALDCVCRVASAQAAADDASLARFLGPTRAGIDAGFSTPVDKRLDPEWVSQLHRRGPRTAYRGDQLETIGMPCGGIGAGQLYVRGDGTLARWWVFGQHVSTHWGQLKNGSPADLGIGYHTYRPDSELMQGFALRVKPSGSDARTTVLSREQYDDIRFFGEYPIAEVHYRSKQRRDPVLVDLEVFTPWVPLDPEGSGYPATVLDFKIQNTSDRRVEATLVGWLENGVCLESRHDLPGLELENRVLEDEGLTFLRCSSTMEPVVPKRRDVGTMGLALLGPKPELAKASVRSDRLPASLFEDEGKAHAAVKAPKRLLGALGRGVTLEPGETKRITFLVTWHFPHYANPDDRGKTGAVGRRYAAQHQDAHAVAEHLAGSLESLARQTHLYRDTYYDSTLPYWFLQRVAMPTSTLSTLTSQWWENGRFYNYEGVGFCAGSCTHVYAYAHAMASLFPSLERNIRRRQDFSDLAQDPQSGRINFRGRDHRLGSSIHASGYAADGQCGVVLRAYREHLMSPDGRFLDRLWPRIKLAMDFMLKIDAGDGKVDGVIHRQQHSTWDTDFYGANTYTGALYLAALAAAERMATDQNDPESAAKYSALRESGSEWTVRELWNGDYFASTFPEDVPVTPSKSWGNVAVWYENGCFSNQLFGQNFASQLGLGYLYPRPLVRKTLRSVYRYNWLPDMSALYQHGVPYAYTFAHSGEAGMLQCSWPLDERPLNAVKLVEHVWTGFEYQVASHLLREGMIDEGFALVRGIHDRYDGAKHNPWNEIEGGDHYGRAMASWGCLLGITGYEYNGPSQELAYAPRYQADDYKAFFTSAEGWGSLVQVRDNASQTNRIEVKWGKLPLKTLRVQPPAGKPPQEVAGFYDGQPLRIEASHESGELVIALPEGFVAEAGADLVVVVRF